jgi:DNA-binding NtrC family response regulator
VTSAPDLKSTEGMPAASEVRKPGEPEQRLLVVEDNEDARKSMQKLLQTGVGVTVDAVGDGGKALEMLGERPYSVVITDLKMPRMSGLQLIKEIQERRLNSTIIVTTGYGSIEEAVQAIQMGAYEFLTKPADPQHLCLLVKRALRERTLQDEVAALREQLAGRRAFQNVLSKSQHMLEIFELIGHIATTTTTVLIEGETGTGKEMIARAIHQASAATRKGSLVAINCAALPETLLESELLGHEKGSFTGATMQRKGRFEQAHGGTLFLDEVGDIPMPMQVKLLRVLQERRFERVGGTDSIEVDVRVIGATNRSLQRLVKEGKFREDLFYRLNVIKIDLPPLRERLEDIPLLATYFAEKYSRPGQASPCVVTPEAMERLLAYSWPGNVRQLENALERACVTARDGQIYPENLPAELTGTTPSRTSSSVDLSRPLPEQLAEVVASFEERYLRKALKKTRGHVGRCATISGLSRRSVTEKISQYKIDRTSFARE